MILPLSRHRRTVFRQPHSGFSRVPFVQACTLSWDGLETTGLICNLSILGLYVHTEAQLEAQREVILRFRLPDEGPEIAAAAIVTWANDASPDNVTGLPQGCGLRFLRVEPDDLRRIAALVARYLAAPREQVQPGVGQPFTAKVRIPFIAACTLTGRFGTRRGSVCNLSVVGVYVALGEIPAPGTRGRITFRLPRSESEFATDFKVTWQNPDVPNRMLALPPGCGLHFENLGAREEELLSDIVNEYQHAIAG